MIGTQITIKNHESGEEIILNDHVTDPDNVIALQSFPTFEPDVRSQNLPRQGAHGEFRLPTYYSGMSIVLQGVIAAENEDKVWDIKHQLDAVMKLSRKGFPAKYSGDDEFPPLFNSTIRLSFMTPDGKEVFLDATPIKAVSYDRPLMQDFILNFQVIVRSTIPYMISIGEEENVEAGELGYRIDGFKIPIEIPFSFESQLVNEITINMETEGFAVVTMNGSAGGAIVNPRITNITNGNTLMVRKILNGSHQKFVVDGIYQTVKDENKLDVGQYVDGEFIFLEKGENILIYTADKVIPN